MRGLAGAEHRTTILGLLPEPRHVTHRGDSSSAVAATEVVYRVGPVGVRSPVEDGYRMIFRTTPRQSTENSTITNPHPIDVEKLFADQLASASPDLPSGLLSTVFCGVDERRRRSAVRRRIRRTQPAAWHSSGSSQLS